MKPSLILVCGLPGSGKSFFSKELAKKMSLVHYNSDIIRKELFPITRSYSETEKQQVYDFLILKTRSCLNEGKSVIIDATFYKNSLRTPFLDLATQLNVDLKVINIYADEILIKDRTSKKRVDSEADYSVYLKLKDAFEPIEQLHLSLQSTNTNIDVILKKAILFLNE